MANILLTNNCNLQCPYCFAHNIVNKNSNINNELSPENFYKIIEYIFKDNNKPQRIGLLGGEPTLCSHFKEYYNYLLNDNRVARIVVMTNGILLNKYNLVNNKTGILINMNKPEIIGNKLYNRIINNIQELFEIYGNNLNNYIILGCNFWDYTGDNSYIINLCKKFNFNKLRFSILVPDYNYKQNIIEYFTIRKQYVMNFFIACLSQNITPIIDCNWMPPCIFSHRDKLILKQYAQDKQLFEVGFKKKSRGVGCGCPIDIYPDLTAARCFGTSKIKKYLFDYNSYIDLKQSFINDIDNKYQNKLFNDSCNNCKYLLTDICYNGCIGFKINQEINKEDSL